MKKIILVILIAAAALVIGICIWKNVHKDETLCTVTYRSQFGYSLSMTEDDGHITVTYIDNGREPIVKKADVSCYDNIVEILETYDFQSWKKLSDKNAETDDSNTLEIGFDSGKTYFFSQSEDLPDMAREIFSAINTCLMEYAGIVK